MRNGTYLVPKWRYRGYFVRTWIQLYMSTYNEYKNIYWSDQIAFSSRFNVFFNIIKAAVFMAKFFVWPCYIYFLLLSFLFWMNLLYSAFIWLLCVDLFNAFFIPQLLVWIVSLIHFWKSLSQYWREYLIFLPCWQVLGSKFLTWFTRDLKPVDF